MKRGGLGRVQTGDGKGKTTAALGLAMRAWGDGLRVLILQFIKGGQTYGELNTIQTLAEADGRICVEQCGLGFTQRGTRTEPEHQEAAARAVGKAREAIQSGAWDLIILDEINYAVKFGLIEESEVLGVLDLRPSELHLVLTGRDARPAVLERADLVTEMKMVKHPYQKGIQAQKGIEF